MTKPITIRKATNHDVPEIVRLLADDMLGQYREDYRQPIPDCYHNAFHAIDADPNQILAVAELNHAIVGTLQLTFIANMSFQGATRALVEGVHVDSTIRSQGVGAQLMQWAADQARIRGCRSIQLTSNTARVDAHRFYERLGFKQSHVGFKRELV